MSRNITDEKLFELKMTKAEIESEEKERRRIAKDLHSGVCQNLVALKIMGDAFIKKQNEHQEIFNKKASIKEMKSLISSTLSDIRRVSHHLNPLDFNQIGLYESLKSLVAVHNNSSTKFSLSINCINEPKDFFALNIYRVVQEFIQNSNKQDSNNEVELRINENKDYFVFKLSNNIQGFEHESKLGGNTILLSLMSRIKKFGGFYNIVSNTSEGVQIYFSMKIESDLNKVA